MTTHLSYQRYGSGCPLVLVHGYLSDREYWKPIIPAMAKHHEVIAIDLLGFGKSPKPTTAAYSLEEHVSALAATIKQATEAPVILVGHSMGALVSARLAIDHPALIDRIVLCNMPLFPDAVQAREVIERTGPGYRLMLYSPFSRVIWPVMRFIWPIILPLLLTRHLVPGPPGAFSTRHSYASRLGSLKHTIEPTSGMELLGKLTHPTTLILGMFDRNIYQRTLDTSHLPDTITVKWVDTGHHTIYQMPRTVVDVIQSPSGKS